MDYRVEARSTRGMIEILQYQRKASGPNRNVFIEVIPSEPVQTVYSGDPIV